MRRVMMAVAGMLACVTLAQAQTTVSTYVVAPGTSVNVTVSGPAGQNFAVIGSSTNSGFSYGGVALAVGADVAILATGTLDGAGQATVAVTPPFPQLDRYYIQGVVSASPNFIPPTPLSSVVVVNNQDARISMPIGGIVQANGTPSFITPGVTVTRTGVGQYTINHAGFFVIPSAIPSITPTAGATVLSMGSNSNATTVTLSADATFYFTVTSVRR